MKRIDTAGRAEDLFGAGKDGFKNGNPATDDPPTIVDAEFLNHVQEEIAGVVEAAEMELDPEDRNQLVAAIAALIADAVPTGNFAMLDVVQAFTKAQRYTPVALVDGASIAWDLDVAPMATVTLGGNRTMAAPTNQRAGGMFVVSVIQDGTGGRTLAWNAAFDFGVDGVPTLPSAAGKIAIFTFLSEGATMRCVGRWNN